MSVTLTPATTLAFQRPLTQLVKQTLTIQNTNSSPIAFKVKTTAPKQYCVRPNSGRVEAGESCQVQVLLQPMKEDPAPGTKCRDKFLVQSVIITPEREASPLTELWSAVEKEDKAGDKESPSIKETKIRCMYLAASEDAAPAPAPGSAMSTASGLDESKFDTVRPSTNGSAREIPAADAAFESTPTPTPTPAIVEPTETRTSTPPNATAPPPSYATPLAPASVADKVQDVIAPVVAPVVAAVKSVAPATTGSPPAQTNGDSSHLAAALAQAQLEIKRLQAQLVQAETTAATLRSRGAAAIPVSSGGAVPGTAQAVVEQKGQDGVPIQVVAGIVVGVFVLTWLFF